MPSGLNGTTVNQLVRSLLDLGHRVTLITAGSSRRETWRAERGRLSVVVVPYRARARARFLDQYRQERRALAAEAARVDADVFHVHWTYEFAAGALASKRRPLLVTAHDSPWTILRTVPDLYRLGRLVLALRVRPRIRRLTAVSPYLAERWRSTMFYRRPIRIVPNAVPQLRIDVAARDLDGPLVLLEIADDSKRKNIPGLLEAFSLVRQALPDARLRLIGAGLEDGGPLAATARANGLAEGVAFLGTMDRRDVAAELGAATLFVHASLEESQGLCMLEALQAGLAVVAGADSGGVAWTMLDGEAARLVDVKDPRAFADAVLMLHADRGEQRRLVEAGQAALATRYAPEVVAGEYLQAYAAAIDDHAARR
ncbi:glycosyltransferase family 4 protein [Amnibacterium endophyticum]|uniref:Glycosyltransferase family 4 protein n=1 Tax=Amnibacterium endophyticum TaxID=2109337 RepID=A0ABW4L9P4_9MICO